jgi:hypothetical protein
MKLTYVVLLTFFGQLIGYDIIKYEQKLKTAKELTAQAVEFFNKHSFSSSMQSFRFDDQWRKADLKIIVIDQNGIVYCDDDEKRIWKPLDPGAEQIQKLSLADVIEKGKSESWVGLHYKNSMLYVYLEAVSLGNQKFCIGAGWFPESGDFHAYQLVEQIVHLCKKTGCAPLFEKINEYQDKIMYGPIGIWIIDEKGKIHACSSDGCKVGDQMSLVNQIASSAKDTLWIEDEYHRAKRISYVRKYIDPATKKTYYVGAHFYPGLGKDALMNIVRNAVEYIKEKTGKISLQDMRKDKVEFVVGPIGAIIINGKEEIVADFRDLNLQVKPDTTAIIDALATKDRNLLIVHERNTYKDVYLERIVTPEGVFYVGAGYWSLSKQHSCQHLTDNFIENLDLANLQRSMARVQEGSAEVTRGDIAIKIISVNGMVWADAEGYYPIWSSIADEKDEKDINILDKIVTNASQGGSWIEVPRYGGTQHIYAKRVNNVTLAEQISQQAEPRSKTSDHAVTVERTAQDIATRDSSLIVMTSYID